MIEVPTVFISTSHIVPRALAKLNVVVPRDWRCVSGKSSAEIEASVMQCRVVVLDPNFTLLPPRSRGPVDESREGSTEDREGSRLHILHQEAKCWSCNRKSGFVVEINHVGIVEEPSTETKKTVEKYSFTVRSLCTSSVKHLGGPVTLLISLTSECTIATAPFHLHSKRKNGREDYSSRSASPSEDDRSPRLNTSPSPSPTRALRYHAQNLQINMQSLQIRSPSPPHLRRTSSKSPTPMSYLSRHSHDLSESYPIPCTYTPCTSTPCAYSPPCTNTPGTYSPPCTYSVPSCTVTPEPLFHASVNLFLTHVPPCSHEVIQQSITTLSILYHHSLIASNRASFHKTVILRDTILDNLSTTLWASITLYKDKQTAYPDEREWKLYFEQTNPLGFNWFSVLTHVAYFTNWQ
ncbi:hypothetical protein Pelo_4628 [Pelomyxa schiedti]|nr:hypothetical protein Pelo_4628 [Pelomyxa schiedti]